MMPINKLVAKEINIFREYISDWWQCKLTYQNKKALSPFYRRNIFARK